MRIEADFVPNRNIKGGSKPGREIKRFNYRMREFIRLWCIDHVADHDEKYFVYAPKNTGRWTKESFLKLDVVMTEVFGPEYLEWRVGDFLNRLINRHHKMYYSNQRSVRCISEEHPDNRTDPKELKDITEGKRRYYEWKSKL